MEKRKFNEWAQLFHCKELNGNMIKALGIILEMYNENKNTPQTYLIAEIGISRNGAYKVMEKLIKIGLVTKHMRVNNNELNYIPNFENIDAMIAKNENERTDELISKLKKLHDFEKVINRFASSQTINEC